MVADWLAGNAGYGHRGGRAAPAKPTVPEPITARLVTGERSVRQLQVLRLWVRSRAHTQNVRLNMYVWRYRCEIQHRVLMCVHRNTVPLHRFPLRFRAGAFMSFALRNPLLNSPCANCSPFRTQHVRTAHDTRHAQQRRGYHSHRTARPRNNALPAPPSPSIPRQTTSHRSRPGASRA